VPAALHTGDDVAATLAAAYPHLRLAAPAGHVVQPAHRWQLDRVVRGGLAARGLRPLDGVRLPAAPTAALRTLLLPGGEYLKVSLDIQVTSTRRTISTAATRNGPALSALLAQLLADDPDGGRLLLLDEVAGAAVTVGSGRDLAAIARRGLRGRLHPGEAPVPGTALYAPSPATGRPLVADLADAHGGGALAFLTDYARLLLPPLLRLATRWGVALEAHLQNCIPTFRAGAPYRLVLRDFAGLRLLLPRLAARGLRVPLWPGSVVGTDDPDVMRAKLGYTALQAHLGELVVRLADAAALPEAAAWRAVRGVVDDVYDGLRADPALAADAAADHAFLTAPRMPHKALVRMRLAGAGDVYVPVANPLA
jgi:siderophore synthetase component